MRVLPELRSALPTASQPRVARVYRRYVRRLTTVAQVRRLLEPTVQVHRATQQGDGVR